jgi:hypothetical protein
LVHNREEPQGPVAAELAVQMDRAKMGIAVRVVTVMLDMAALAVA